MTLRALIVHTGINLSLLLQLSATMKQAKLWTTATTLLSFLVVSTFQFLVTYVTVLGCANHSDDSGDMVAWFGTQQLTNSWVAIRCTGLIATWFLDSFVVCFDTGVTPVLAPMICSFTSAILFILPVGETYGSSGSQ